MSEKKVFVSGLQEGRQVRDMFLIARKNLAETKAGKPYLSLTLMDKTGEIEARVWENARNLDGEADVGDIIILQAVAKSYQNQVQLTVSGFQQAEKAQVSLADFMPASNRPVPEMRQELASLVATITDTGLRKLLAGLFQGDLFEQFSTAPAAKRMHHAYIGGLLEHTLSVTGMAVKTAEHYPGLDRDLLVAGALVHDIAKTKEFSYHALPFEYTDCGRLLGHLVLGVEMVREAAAKVDELLPARVDALAHLVLSHHGRYEFGAPVLPMTPEAILLHHLDDMDAKMNYIDQLREKQEEPGWTDFQRPLERFLYLQPKAKDAGQAPSPPAEMEISKASPAGSRTKVQADQAAAAQRQPSLFGSIAPRTGPDEY
jgi:3'-5' exoribonuclease